MSGVATCEPSWQLRPDVLCDPQIPLPLHGVAPRVILGGPWWRKTRQAALASTENHCVACGVHASRAKYLLRLEGHERYDINYVLGWVKYVETVPLCHFCHNYIHVGRLDYLLSIGKIHHAKYVAIIQHGDAILAQNDLKRPEPYSGPIAPWEKWRMSACGTERGPTYPTYQEWKRAHA